MDGTLLSDALLYKIAFKGDIPEHLETCMEIIQEIATTIPRISNPRTDRMGLKKQVLIGALVTGQALPPNLLLKETFKRDI